ncbi:MAG: RNA polymerase sigma-70 factor [Gemmatimonadales bacterium]
MDPITPPGAPGAPLDDAAFEALFRDAIPRLTDFATRYLGAREAAEETVQDVFLELWTRRTQLRFRESPRAYLYRSVRNRCLNALERRRLGARIKRRILGEEPIAPPPDPFAGDEADALRRALRQLVGALPPRTRLAVTLRYDHGLSYREAAEVMGISIKGVERLLRLALIRLRGAAADVGIDATDLSIGS